MQSALLKNNDRGNKKALIGKTNQGLFALEGTKLLAFQQCQLQGYVIALPFREDIRIRRR